MFQKNLLKFSMVLMSCLLFWQGSLSAQSLYQPWSERFATKLTPQLEQALINLPASSTLNLYAVMKDRLAKDELMNRVKGIPLRNRHKIVASSLRAYAEESQNNVRSFLSSRNGNYGPKPVKTLWLSNTLLFSGTAEDIKKVLEFDEVGYLGLLQDYPPESYLDANPRNSESKLFSFDSLRTKLLQLLWNLITPGTDQGNTQQANSRLSDDRSIENGNFSRSTITPNLTNLQAPLCWDLGIKGEGVLILNIDTGVDYNHPDLADRIWSNPGEEPYGTNGIDDDNNGYIDDFMGWDFAADDTDP